MTGDIMNLVVDFDI